MDIDIGLLGAICREGMSKFYEFHIGPNMLEDRARVVFSFMEEHWKLYKEVPKPETIRMETGIDVLVGQIEPLEFWCNQVRSRSLYAAMKSSVRDIVEHMEKLQPEKALAAMQTAAFKIGQDVRTADRPVSIFANPQGMLDDYEKSKLGILGVPSPWPSMNALTKGWQPEDFALIAARPGSGKCLGPGTRILMYDGSSKVVEDVKVGDQLMGPDSTPRNVMSICQGREEMFEITPIKGETWTCNRSHVLSLRMSSENGSSYKKDQIFNLSIDEYLQKNDKFKHHAKQWRTGVDFPSRKVLVDPYLVGLWLGDGTVDRPNINNPEPEIREYLEEYCSKNNFILYNERKKKGECPVLCLYGQRGVPNPFSHFVRNHCYRAESKIIPREYLVNDRETRLSLLAGLIDTDGFIQDGCELITKYSRLKDDILFLARSLGFAAYASLKIGRIKEIDFEGEYWRISISGDLSVIPCKVPRKKSEVRQQIKSVLNTGFTLKSLGEGDYYGFELDGDHLFLLGDFTVTHNTWMLLIMAVWAWRENYKVLLASTEMSHNSLRRRVAAMVTKLSYSAIRDGILTKPGEQIFREKIFEHAGDNRFLIMGDGFDVTFNSIEAAIIEHEPDLVCIDGLYMLKSATKYDRSNDNAAEVFKQAKGLAKRRKVPIIANTQMNRPQKGATTTSADGDLARLAFSDAAAMMTDYVFFLTQTKEMKAAREMTIEPAKVREADFISNIKVNWKFDTLDFSEMTSKDDQDKIEVPSAFLPPKQQPKKTQPGGFRPAYNDPSDVPPDDPW